MLQGSAGGWRRRAALHHSRLSSGSRASALASLEGISRPLYPSARPLPAPPSKVTAVLLSRESDTKRQTTPGEWESSDVSVGPEEIGLQIPSPVPSFSQRLQAGWRHDVPSLRDEVVPGSLQKVFTEAECDEGEPAWLTSASGLSLHRGSHFKGPSGSRGSYAESTGRDPGGHHFPAEVLTGQGGRLSLVGAWILVQPGLSSIAHRGWSLT